MKETVIITRKVQIRSEDKTFWDLVREYNRIVFRAANRVMQVHYLREALENDILNQKKTEENTPKRQEVRTLLYGKEGALGMSDSNLGYTILGKEFSELSSYVRMCISQNVYQDFKNEINDVRSGKSTQSTYRYGMPIPFSKSAITNLTAEGFVWLKKSVQFVFGADRSNNKSIVKKIIDGEYALCDSAIQIKDKKAFLLLVVKIPTTKNELLESVTATVDISHKCPIKLDISSKKLPIEVGDTANVERIRLMLSQRFTTAQKSVKFAKGGHGRKRKLKFLDTFEALEKNTVKTLNHAITKEVVRILVRERVSSINIIYSNPKEDVDNIEEQKYLIRYWGYFEIANTLKYKCEREGIQVKIKEEPIPESLLLD